MSPLLPPGVMVEAHTTNGGSIRLTLSHRWQGGGPLEGRAPTVDGTSTYPVRIESWRVATVEEACGVRNCPGTLVVVYQVTQHGTGDIMRQMECRANHRHQAFRINDGPLVKTPVGRWVTSRIPQGATR